MPDNSISVVFKGYDQLSSVMKTIAASGKGLSKEYEDLERRGKPLASGNENLQKKIASLNRQVISAKSAMQDAARQFKKTGDEADGIKLENATREYERLSAALKEAKSASNVTMQSMKNNANEMRKLFDASGKAGAPGGESSGGLFSRIFGGDLSKKLSNSGILQLLGDSASNAISVAAESALGQPLASLGSSLASGVLSGAASGAVFGPTGVLIGAGLGAVSGLVNGGAQVYQARDDAFKDYYGNLYDTANAATAESLTSGSALAAGRETTKLSFNTLLGGEEASSAFLADVLETANTTPFLYDDLVGISKTMLSFGTAVDDVIPTLTKVGDAGAALGLSIGDIGTVATYLGRMQSSNKASLEYLNPLNERGFSVFQWLADDLKVSVGAVYDKISKGALSGSYVSDVILRQFEKLYGGMMGTQSQSTEGLDSTLQGLKENVDAAGGDAYNERRKDAKQADIAAYSGALGDKLAEVSAAGGEAQAYGENLKDQYQREALSAVLLGDLDKKSTVFSEEDAAKLEGLAAEFSEAEKSYQDGSKEAGKKMEDLREEAEALATAAYESSEWGQMLHDTELEQIAATRELTVGLESATNALEISNERSKGGAAGFLDSLFGSFAEEDSEPQTRAKNSLGLFAYGLDYVPYDEFPALLHQGERVLTAAEARTMDRQLLYGLHNGDSSFGADKRPPVESRLAGSFAFGLGAAPADHFPALLHQGERIRPPEGTQSSGDVQVSLHVDQLSVRQDSDVDAIAEALAQKLRAAILRGGA